MIFDPLNAEEIARNWDWLGPMLKPAIDPDPGNTVEDVYASLVNGPDLLTLASGGGNVAIVFEITPDAICWLKYMAGNVMGGPKARIKTIREGLSHIEQKAADAGCYEMRICGRDWSVLLSDYEPMPDWPNGLRKVLRMKEAA